MRRPRVLYAPRNISGQPGEYAEAVRALGFPAQVWSVGEPAYGFGADVVLDQTRLLADAAYRWDVLDRAVRGFDVFHLQYGRSLLPPAEPVLPELWDLPLLRSLGKRVFVHWRGSDVRLPSVHAAREPDSYLRGAGAAGVDEDAVHRRVSVARRYADRMLVSTPGLLDYVPDAVWVPHVLDTAEWYAERGPEPAVPLAVHVPSSRATKGSDAVEAALAPLAAAGLIRYRTLSGLDRSGLRSALQEADLVVDSLAIGDHGLVSVEAMAAGAVALAHVHERNRERNPGVPVVEVTAGTLADVVRRLAADPDERARLRGAGLQWVRERHDRAVVGRLLADLYTTPPTPVDLGHPEWPRTDARRRLERLEAEVERLRACVDPVVQGADRRLRPQRWETDRLLRRIEVLEEALARHEPGSPLLAERGARRGTDRPRTVVERLAGDERVERAARRAYERWRRARRGLRR